MLKVNKGIQTRKGLGEKRHRKRHKKIEEKKILYLGRKCEGRAGREWEGRENGKCK